MTARLHAQTNCGVYDRASFASWVPLTSHMYNTPIMASLMQSTPADAAGTNETDVPGSACWALLASTKAIKQLDARLDGRPERHVIGAMDSHLLPPSCESWWASTLEDAEGMFHLHLPADAVSRFTRSEGLTDPLNRLGPAIGILDTALAGVARTAIDLLDAWSPPPRLASESLAHTLSLRLSQLAGGAPRSPLARFSGHDQRLRRAIEYLGADLSADVGLDPLSDLVGLSAGHLAALFRSGTGVPPHRWLVRRRIERASEMLRDPRLSITEIAFACGFASSQHFATVFRRAMGTTPTAYRRSRTA